MKTTKQTHHEVKNDEEVKKKSNCSLRASPNCGDVICVYVGELELLTWNSDFGWKVQCTNKQLIKVYMSSYNTKSYIINNLYQKSCY